MAVTDFPYQAFGKPKADENDSRARSVRDRMVPPMRGSLLWGWLGPIIVTIFGGVLRFAGLGHPKAVVFDETYYAKDAYSLITWLVERVTIKDADKAILAGDTDIWQKCAADALDKCASYVVHPPVGKWMIGAGEWLFGMTPFGWRFAAAVIGTLSILVLARVARRMTRSTLLGCFAGFLLALDGLHFVLSRTALLDIFLMFWVLAAFACLVVDRDRARERLVDWYETSPLTPQGPYLGLRPWRIAAGVCLGLAMGVKWSGLFFAVAFAIMSLLWDFGARRAVGLRHPYLGAFSKDVPTGLAAFVMAPFMTYMATWIGWFVSAEGYGRKWEQATSSGPGFFLFDSMRSWIQYQWQVFSFHNGLETSHPYMSDPWQWPLLLRPVAFHYEGRDNTCGAKDCSEAVLGVGTPVIWFGALAALVALIAWYVASRDWRAGAVLLAYAMGWLPWFYFAIAQNRTMFLFYAIPMVPFMVLAITLCAGVLIGPSTHSLGGPLPMRRTLGAAAVGAFALLALINFWWLHPILTAELIPYTEWKARMLFDKRWI
ncbi:dolichyl-phosphate-mannose--protein mannosyltransferase [Nonomuraea cavernae]|uniref:Polyprenol-phosphate-mannose--protein mannosyltransferase n=1 Tax=Nonomuraea cavernae TaxID=2045107 RepID=A0A918DHR5_9ACTN|nr:phospholipid carrier-dependent glycosyltransferase [Nonomuraea cavernae]MCA2186887.1 phospholipid carrier-dependent glycosyltransferase [Nonomuraea cavernae]GGO67291.1 phospholipid carrier-dependent glycosyltransferase [Nonomuraea cavernae]